MKLTFGKWQGWNTEDMARTFEARGYLEWGKENLKSPKWRKECERVLKITNYDEELSIKAIMHEANAGGEYLDFDEAQIFVQDKMRKEAAWQKFQTEKINLQTRFIAYLLKDENITEKAATWMVRSVTSEEEYKHFTMRGAIAIIKETGRLQYIERGLKHYWVEMDKLYMQIQ